MFFFGSTICYMVLGRSPWFDIDVSLTKVLRYNDISLSISSHEAVKPYACVNSPR